MVSGWRLAVGRARARERPKISPGASFSSSSWNPGVPSDVEPNLWTGLRMGLLSRRDYRTQPGVLTPGTRPKIAPPCLSAVVPGMWDEGGKGRKIGVIDS